MQLSELGPTLCRNIECHLRQEKTSMVSMVVETERSRRPAIPTRTPAQPQPNTQPTTPVSPASQPWMGKYVFQPSVVRSGAGFLWRLLENSFFHSGRPGPLPTLLQPSPLLLKFQGLWTFLHHPSLPQLPLDPPRINEHL